MHRFYVEKNRIEKKGVIFEQDIEHQIRNVLRLIDSNKVIVFDNSGYEYLVELRNVNSKKIYGEIIEKTKKDSEALMKISLYQSVLKSKERFEYILQKCTELGVVKFVPLITSRTISKINKSLIASKRLRWQKVIKEAGEQSGRVVLPELSEIKYFNQLCGMDKDLTIILWEEEEVQDIKNQLSLISNDASINISRMNIIVGPEGGFDKNEIQYAKDTGMKPVSLGKRILRSDTAGIAAVSCVMYEYGQFVP
ncbi:MAG: 16S rRNA (uracil(1498)-N(3))-methyltransferase [SAR202 cluster bacterium]|nr:16S rRNA methyltransferase [Chloroflexota bacterium]MQG39611.1 16S rRNA (uracil(1498)-N(3))-methyltransferase [SAR202 cluster bacterium]|tara:strand:+ start:5208 stop:5963 length:756 start_codon:yes stop_codon:yes gene_type:complete